jgi:hypothetical protein
MTMSYAQGIARSWTRRVIQGMARGHVATVGGATVVRSMGQLVALDSPPAADHSLSLPRAGRNDLLAEWTRSGHLSYGDAERLMALDETTNWQA